MSTLWVWNIWNINFPFEPSFLSSYLNNNLKEIANLNTGAMKFKIVSDTNNARCLNHCSNSIDLMKDCAHKNAYSSFYNKAVFEFGASQKSFRYWETGQHYCYHRTRPLYNVHVYIMISFELIQTVMSCTTKSTHTS